MRIIHAVPDEEDIERIIQGFRDLSKDPAARRKFWTEVGLYDENGNIAEPFRDM